MNREFAWLIAIVVVVAAFVAGMVVGRGAVPLSVTVEASPILTGYISNKSSGYINGWLKYNVIIKPDFAVHIESSVSDLITISVSSSYFDQVKVGDDVKVTLTQQGWVIVEAP